MDIFLTSIAAPRDGALDIVVTGIRTRSSRDAVGARIEVTTASGRMLHNHVSVSTGLMSSSDRRVHFGLGPESAIASIEIRWPGGQVQTLSDVKADQILRVREPE